MAMASFAHLSREERIGLGVAAIVVVWLVFSVLKKVIGLLLLAAVVVAGFVLWQNPDLLRTLMAWMQDMAEGGDYSVIMGITILLGTLTISFNLIVDILYAWIDPRIRY